MPRIDVLTCLYCGKSVSTEFVAQPTDTPDKGLIIRAVIACPECFAARFIPIHDDDRVAEPLKP